MIAELVANYLLAKEEAAQEQAQNEGIQACIRKAQESGGSVWCVADGYVYYPDGSRVASDLDDIED